MILCTIAEKRVISCAISVCYPMSNIGKVITEIICNLRLIMANTSVNHYVQLIVVIIFLLCIYKGHECFIELA